MTRARELLYLMNVIVRRIWGNVEYQEPARFLTEIPGELIAAKDYTAVTRAHYSVEAAKSFRPSSYPSRDYTADPGDGGYRRAMNAVAAPSSGSYSTSALVGQKIDHPEYGMGKIISAEGSGDDQKVMVEFAGRDRRKFLVRYLKTYLGD